MAVVLSSSTAALSATPLQTFLSTLALTTAMVLISMAILVAIDRGGRRRSED